VLLISVIASSSLTSSLCLRSVSLYDVTVLRKSISDVILFSLVKLHVHGFLATRVRPEVAN
jgi:hypothetical protein